MGSENEDDNDLVFEEVGLSVTYISEENASYYTVRTLEIKDLRVSSCTLYMCYICVSKEQVH